MNKTQQGVLIAIVIALMGGGAYAVFRDKGDAPRDVASETATKTDPAAAPAATLADLGGTVDKTSRLMADAATATAEMKDLFKDGRLPEKPVADAARGKIEAALSGVSAIEIPADAQGAPVDMVKKAKENAAHALAILKALPADAAGILAALGEIEATLTGQPAPAAATPATPAAAAPASPAETTAAAAAAAQQAKATTPPATPASINRAEAFPAIPAFDLLRVEPDGSTVIAGRAATGMKIDVLDGDKVVSSTQSGATGDFAAIFENPLAPGDHQLTIRATGKDGKEILSEEIATVSVPRDKAGDLLAMVSKPGEASRVITAPGTKQVASAAADGGAAVAAAAPATPSAAPAQPAAPAKSALQISAVELEGDRVFVAGKADPKTTVTAYADERMIGSAKTSDDGHFVVDGVLPLAVGSHQIRVDELDASGKVAFRAQVPFDRPEGEQVAAVATPGADQSAAGNGAAMQPLGDGTFDMRRDEAVKAFGLLQKLFEGGKEPSAEEFAAARSATAIALQSLIDFALPDSTDSATKAMVATTRDKAAKALELLKALPDDGHGAGPALAAIGDLIRQTVSPSGGAVAPAPAAQAQVAQAPDAGDAQTAPAPAASSAAGEPTTVEQAPLTGTKSSVIIRRGDTLWQISRRVYGRGVRYTTIYLANKEQITNPDRILPGQVFGVPDAALPNSEELHRQRLHGNKSP